MDSLVHKKPILGKVRRYDGYTVQNICIETLPGEHVFGSIYTPIKKGKHPLIICLMVISEVADTVPMSSSASEPWQGWVLSV